MHKNIRKNLHDRLGIYDDHNVVDPHKIKQEIKENTNALEYIISLAKDRLIMGGIRYGHLPKSDKYIPDYIADKFDIYKRTGNFEMLIDIVNYVALEYVLHSHPKYYFKAIDRKD